LRKEKGKNGNKKEEKEYHTRTELSVHFKKTCVAASIVCGFFRNRASIEHAATASIDSLLIYLVQMPLLN
jgi:hypothetical protein